MDIVYIVDGALLVDLWADLLLPRRLRTAWQQVIDQALGVRASISALGNGHPRVAGDP